MKPQEQINWTKVWISEDGMEAQLIKNLLEIEEIPYQLRNINSNNLFPDTGIASVDVYVPEEMKEKALKMIKENFEE